MKQSILIIQDSKALRYLIATTLSEKYLIKSVQTSNQAMQLFISNEEIDLVILDIASGSSESFELFEHISSSSILKDIPVVVLSGNNDEELRKNVLEMGASAFIAKPFDPVVLKAEIDRILLVDVAEVIHKKKRVFNLNINLF